jgi:hypothetical protein
VRWTPGTALAAGTRYYLLDGDGQTAASYHFSTSVDDGRGAVFNDPYVIWEFGLNYSFRRPRGKVGHKVGLNLKNAFNLHYTYGTGTLGDGRQIIGSYSVTF